jgi:mRNA-degrading endonuclease RelE of RelBE toxin-antitoxin system
MPYDILLAPEAVQDLHELKANVRATVRAALATHLRHQPTQISKSRIKRLRGVRRPQYRLRVDDIRIFYDVQEQVVEILAIIDKLEADTWLARFGEPEQGATDEADSAFGSEE